MAMVWRKYLKMANANKHMKDAKKETLESYDEHIWGHTRAISKIDYSMEKVSHNSAMVLSMKAAIGITNTMDMVSTLMLMEMCTKDNG